MADELAPGALLPTTEDVREAAARLAGVANRTPVVTSRWLDEQTGAKVFLKCECFQRSGSFKFRGAYNALSRLTVEERKRGVVTHSSGNFAQALALAGRLLDIPTTVVMPRNAPAAKLAATRGYGAEVVLYDPETAVREEISERLAAERGSALIPPFDHRDVIAGQGTAALELLDEAGHLDAIYVQCGGGGLISGIALAARSIAGCSVIGVEPETADDATRTFRTGVLQTVRNPATIADGLRTPSLGQLTWPLVRANVAEMITVSEAEIVDAMRLIWSRLKVVAEPSGAVALAGFLAHGARSGSGAERVGVIVSGGNVDLAAACELFSSG